MNDFDRLVGDSLKAVGEEFKAQDLASAQREFMSRRRRRFGLQVVTGIAVAGAAAAALIFVVTNQPSKDGSLPVQHEPAGTVVIDVGDEPRSVAATFDDAVWVTNAADGTVTRIDPSDNTTTSIEVGGNPDEIVAGLAAIYVSDESNGRISVIDPDTSEVAEVFSMPVDGRLDLAIGEGALFVANASSGKVFRLEPPDYKEPFLFEGEGQLFSDVSGDDDEAWALGPSHIRLLDSGPHTNDNRPTIDLQAHDVGPNADLLVAGETMWASGNGAIRYFDLTTGDFKDITFDGDYADMSFDGTSVWALAGRGGDENGLLYRFGLDGDQIGDPVAVDGRPLDVSVLGGYAWVTQSDADTVSRIPTATALPLPSDTPSSDPTPDASAKAKSTVMVFSKDGDIYAAYADGTIEALTQTQQAESNPIFVENLFNPKYPAILFERASGASGSDLAYLDLKTMEEQEIAPGSLPVSLGNRIAWLEAGPEFKLGVAELFSEPFASLPIMNGGKNVEPTQMVQGAARWVYALSDAGSVWTIISMDSTGELAESIDRADGGAHYIALSSSDSMDGVDVIRACCADAAVRGSELTKYEVGRVSGWAAGENTYETLVDVSAMPFADDPGLFRMTPADGLSATLNGDGTVTWGPTDAPGWIVSDGVHAYLVTGDGDMQELPFEVHGGMDVNESRSL
ncbi:MAG: hypothetical protein QOG54_2513 [Actinomycetota bacterium]|jgi:hypothetical protein|nr:hypothetical protein [Actinomycetota bacterium]